MSRTTHRVPASGYSGNPAESGLPRDDAAASNPLNGPRHDYLVPVVLPFHLPTEVYGAMLAIWHLRAVLQRRFPLHKGSTRDFLRFLAWCTSEGRRQYLILRSIPGWDEALSCFVDLPPVRGDRWSGTYSVAMFLYGIARSHYTFGPMLESASARDDVARAFWRGDRHVRCMPPPARWQREELVSRFASGRGFAEAIRDKQRDAGRSTEQLIKDFRVSDVFLDQESASGLRRPDNPEARRQQPVSARIPENIRRSPINLSLRSLKSIGWMLERIKQRPSEFELANITARIPCSGRAPARIDGPFGVNLVGYARGELGIGEDVRMLAMALNAHGVPFCIVDVKLGSHVSQLDASVEHWVVDAPRYPINIFCMTGVEHARFACEWGLDIFAGRYTIGLWPWELPDWPASCRYMYGVVDEIWGISRYTANAYRAAPCPVYAMSLPVAADPVGSETRDDFALPRDHYLFVFAFDFNSTLARKNPEGAIRAFRQAFPAGKKEKVGLVLKASHSSNAKDNGWDRIKSLIRGDPRIFLIDATLRRASVLALYRCCDCFVSLHRAEGFGRGLAEALLLGLRVIATGFSGNMDYCDEQRVDLVRHQLRELHKHEYFWGQGQHWAEPDIDHAAQLMRKAAAGGRSTHAERIDFSPASVGKRYVRRLEELFHQLNAAESSIC